MRIRGNQCALADLLWFWSVSSKLSVDPEIFQTRLTLESKKKLDCSAAKLDEETSLRSVWKFRLETFLAQTNQTTKLAGSSRKAVDFRYKNLELSTQFIADLAIPITIKKISFSEDELIAINPFFIFNVFTIIPSKDLKYILKTNMFL